MAAATATSIAGDTVDLLCWRTLGTTSGGVVEQTLALNPGLAQLGPVLPVATVVTLPTVSAAVPATIETVNLWD